MGRSFFFVFSLTHVDLQLELCSSPMIESYDCLYLMVKEWGFSLHFDVILLH